MLILPAIDLIAGKCVRLKQGNYTEETVYDLDPVGVAQRFESDGAEWLHIVDLDGAKEGKPQNLQVLKDITRNTKLKIEFGGGVRSLESAEEILRAGAERVIVGTKLVTDPDLASLLFRNLGERMVAGLDARDGKVAVTGWTETSNLSILEAAKRVEADGARRVIVTDIAKDSMLQGPNLDLLEAVLSTIAIPVIQSGGIASLDDITQLSQLKSRKCEGVIVGKAIYEKRFTVRDALKAAEILN